MYLEIKSFSTPSTITLFGLILGMGLLVGSGSKQKPNSVYFSHIVCLLLHCEIKKEYRRLNWALSYFPRNVLCYYTPPSLGYDVQVGQVILGAGAERPRLGRLGGLWSSCQPLYTNIHLTEKGIIPKIVLITLNSKLNFQ